MDINFIFAFKGSDKQMTLCVQWEQYGMMHYATEDYYHEKYCDFYYSFNDFMNDLILLDRHGNFKELIVITDPKLFYELLDTKTQKVIEKILLDVKNKLNFNNLEPYYQSEVLKLCHIGWKIF